MASQLVKNHPKQRNKKVNNVQSKQILTHGTLMVANAKNHNVKRNTVNAFRWEYFAIQLNAHAMTAEIQKKRYNVEWITMIF